MNVCVPCVDQQLIKEQRIVINQTVLFGDRATSNHVYSIKTDVSGVNIQAIKQRK